MSMKKLEKFKDVNEEGTLHWREVDKICREVLDGEKVEE